MWKPPEYPGPCFDLHFDRFDGLIFEAEKPFENVCATGASPVLNKTRGQLQHLRLQANSLRTFDQILVIVKEYYLSRHW